MRNPRQYHHGYVLDSVAWQRCVLGVVILCAFSLMAGVAQSTGQLMERNRVANQDERYKQSLLAAARRARDEASQEKSFYQSNPGIVAAARPLGWGWPGERRVLPDPPKRSTPRESTRD